MGLRRDRKSKAATAAQRSTKAPAIPKKPARKEKAHAPAAAKLKPAPPITDCLKCSKLREARADATHWKHQAEKYLGELEARTKAALAGVAVVLDKGAVERILEEELHPTFRQVVGVFRDIALNAAAEDKDRIKAASIVKDQVAGKVPDKVNLDAKLTGPMYFVPGLPAPAAKPAPEGDGA